MSHNAVGIKVFVSNVTPVTFVQTGSQTLTITCDNNASEMTEVVIPSGLGTLESTTFTRTGATTSQIVCTLDIASVPASGTTNHAIALNTVGIPATGSVEYFSIAKTAFTPAALMVGTADTWFQATDASAVGDGNLVSSVTPGYGNRGALPQASSTYQPTYKASIPELNNKPGLTINSHPNEWLNGLLSNSNYLFTIGTTAFTLAFVWVPVAASASTSIFFSKNEGYGSGWLSQMTNVSNQQEYLYLGGANQGAQAYGNNDTTAPRRLILSSDSGTACTVVEPTTGINRSVTAGGTSISNSVSSTILGGTDVHIAEMILVTGRELTTDEKTNLNNYWISRYGS
jgi:hypothetical protein